MEGPNPSSSLDADPYHPIRTPSHNGSISRSLRPRASRGHHAACVQVHGASRYAPRDIPPQQLADSRESSMRGPAVFRRRPKELKPSLRSPSLSPLVTLAARQGLTATARSRTPTRRSQNAGGDPEGGAGFATESNPPPPTTRSAGNR